MNTAQRHLAEALVELAGRTPVPMGASLFARQVDYYPWLTFWYGIGPTELMRLPNAIKQIYINELPELIFTQQRMAITAASFPNMTERGRDTVMETLTPTPNKRLRIVRGSVHEEVEPEPRVTREEYHNNLSSMGITVIQEAPRRQPTPIRPGVNPA